MRIKNIYLFLSLSIIATVARTENRTKKIEQFHLGQFSLPPSQQPGPLMSFGQNLMDKGDLQLYTFDSYLNGDNKDIVIFVPSVLYALLDNLSLFVRLRSVPYANIDGDVLHSLENAIVQFEYAFIDKNTTTTMDMVTFVANTTIPIQSAVSLANFNNSGIFLGITASHMDEKWYLFGAPGISIPFKRSHGVQFFYQLGMGRNIRYAPDGWIFNWLLEMDGTYTAKTNAQITDRSASRNNILVTPSLWFSTRRFIIQGGISWVAGQTVLVGEKRDYLFVSCNIGWKF